MKVSAKWIHAHHTSRGAWTRRQLAAIGVSWPPARGWMWRAEGMEITEAQRQTFEAESARVHQKIPFDNGTVSDG